MPDYSARVRSQLRSLAHPLKPLVQIGSEGLSDAVFGAVATALEQHELIKVKLGQSFPGDKRTAGPQLAEATESTLIQTIGRTVVLFRARAKPQPGKPRYEIKGGDVRRVE